MKELMKRTSKISALILGLFLLGCSSDDGGGVEVPKVVAGFSFTLNAVTGTATFTNTSTNATSYEWNFGDGNTSTEKNPIKTYETGNYTVSLKASNTAGASDTTTEEIAVEIPTDSGNGGGDEECTGTPETSQSLSAADFNVTFQTDPTESIASFGAGLSWINNPDTDNTVNTSCKVGQIDRVAEDLFANNQIVLDAKLDLNANAGFKMKVWSSTVGTNVLLKLEDQANAASFTEVSAVTTVANEWEELTFAFPSTESNKYDFIILFFELNTNTVATYYIDDFALYTREGGGDTGGGDTGGSGTDENNLITNGDFEAGDTTGWETSIAGNSGTFMATNSISNCGTYSGEFIANEAQLMTIRQANLGVGMVTPNSDITISFDLQGAAGDGGVFIAQVFSESTTAGVTKTDILNNGEPIQLNASWTRYSFTTTTGPDVSNGITLLLKTECGAVAGCTVNANIDNVYVALGTSGGPACGGGNTGGGNTGGGDTGGGDTGGGTGNGVELGQNGDFETGVQDPWLFFDIATTNGGLTTLSNTTSSGSGTFSARVESGPGNNPGIKLERFGIGTIMPNQQIEVKVDANIETLAGGAIVNVLAFSESSIEGAPAVLHNLGQINGAAGSWNTNTFTFTTAGDVSGGISVLIEVVCGGVPDCDGVVFFDNISIQIVE